MSTTCPRILNPFFGSAWAMLPSKFDENADLLALRVADDRDTPAQVSWRRRPQRPLASSPPSSSVAVLNLFGAMAQRMNLVLEASGGISCEATGQPIDTLARDHKLSAIVRNIDSPGGEVFGVQDLQGRMVLGADAVRAGMADREGTLDEVLAELSAKRPNTMTVPVASLPSLLRSRPNRP